jgi:hypothetical protein
MGRLLPAQGHVAADLLATGTYVLYCSRHSAVPCTQALDRQHLRAVTCAGSTPARPLSTVQGHTAGPLTASGISCSALDTMLCLALSLLTCNICVLLLAQLLPWVGCCHHKGTWLLICLPQVRMFCTALDTVLCLAPRHLTGNTCVL